MTEKGSDVTRKTFLKGVGLGFLGLGAAVVEKEIARREVPRLISATERCIEEGRFRERLAGIKLSLEEKGITTRPGGIAFIETKIGELDELKKEADDSGSWHLFNLVKLAQLHAKAAELHQFFDPDEREKRLQREKKGKPEVGISYYPPRKINENSDGASSGIADDPVKLAERIIRRTLAEKTGIGLPDSLTAFYAQRKEAVWEIAQAMFGKYASGLFNRLELEISENGGQVVGTTVYVDVDRDFTNNSSAHELGHLPPLFTDPERYEKSQLNPLFTFPLDQLLAMAERLPEVIDEMDKFRDELYFPYGYRSSLYYMKPIYGIGKFLEQATPLEVGGETIYTSLREHFPALFDVTGGVPTTYPSDFFIEYRKFSALVTDSKFSKVVEDSFWNFLVNEIFAEGVSLAVLGMLPIDSPRYKMTFNFIKSLNPASFISDDGWREKLIMKVVASDVRGTMEYIRSDLSLGEEALKQIQDEIEKIFLSGGNESRDDVIKVINKMRSDAIRRTGGLDDLNWMSIVARFIEREHIRRLYHFPGRDIYFGLIFGPEKWQDIKNDPNFKEPPPLEKMLARKDDNRGDFETT